MTSALADHLWQSTLFSVLAALLAFALRKNRAQARYWLWLIASLKFLVPFSLVVALGSYLAPSKAIPFAQPGFSLAMQEISQPFSAPAVSIANVHPTVNVIPIALFAVWFCGFAIVAFRWWLHWCRIRAAVRTAWGLRTDAQNGDWLRISTPQKLRKQNRSERNWLPVPVLPAEAGLPVLSSPTLLEPGIFGIFRPVLLLPEGIADHLTREQFEAILAHELCHVRRRDNLFAALHMLVEAIFWFHPLVWWIGARLIEERERACDEEVLQQGNKPAVYAESVLKTCQFYLESPLACMSGVTGSDLKKRIVRIMTERAAHPIDFARKALLAVAGALAITGPLAFGLMNPPDGRAQTPAAQPIEVKPKFEVASIKPDKSGARNISFHLAPGGRIYANNVTLKLLIEMAYDIKDFQLTGGPKWIDSMHYDLQAEPPESVGKRLQKLSRDQQQRQLRLMAQSLLADRCKLVLSRTTKELPIYALVVSKHGPKIHPAHLEPNGPPGMRRRVGVGQGEFDINNAPLTTLADGLSRTLGRTVVDGTGLKGFYDFTLHWTPDRNEDVMFHGRTFKGSPGTGPSIFTALQEQLGLKLKPGKGPVEVLAIDHVEQPSAN